jgi:uncharacterized protein YcfJ
MKLLSRLGMAACLALVAPTPTFADTTSDQRDCSAIATRQTGYNPAAPPPVAQASPQVAGSGARVRGAAAGAVIGGASGGDAGKGAAAGAVAGGVAQRSRNRRAARSANEGAAAQQSAYNQAMASCMAGRGH